MKDMTATILNEKMKKCEVKITVEKNKKGKEDIKAATDLSLQPGTEKPTKKMILVYGMYAAIAGLCTLAADAMPYMDKPEDMKQLLHSLIDDFVIGVEDETS